MASDPIRLAIIGSGLAGAALANALAHHSHLQIHIFEAAPVVSERGAAVALATNTQEALRHIFGASNAVSAEEVMSRAQAVPMKSSRLAMGCGPEAGQVVLDIENEHQDRSVVVHRGSLMRELWGPLPQAAIHVNKKLVSIKTTDTTPLAGDDGDVEIGFEDGTSMRFDGVIGADGVFSAVRKFVLRDHDWDSVGPSPSGFWDSRVLVPYDRARQVLGETYFEAGQDRQYGYLGPKAYLMHDVLEDRTLVQCIMSGISQDIPHDRKITLNRERLEAYELKEWLDGPVASKMIDLLLLDQPELVGYYNLEHKYTPSYADGAVCIVGDAAHAVTPWQGSGTGQAFEDAAVLGYLCGGISTRADVRAAFKAFDAVRRTRCERVVHSSTETGRIMCGLSSDVGMNVDEMKKALEPRWEFIHAFDMDAHKQEALEKLREFQRK